MLNTVNETHKAHAAQREALRELAPHLMKALSIRSKVPVIVWQGRCVKAVQKETVLPETIRHISAHGASSNFPSVVPKNVPARVKKISKKEQSDSNNTTVPEQKELKTKLYTHDKVTGIYKCLHPGCDYENKHRQRIWKHSQTHGTGPVTAYRCLADGCSLISLTSTSIFIHIERQKKAEEKNRKENSPHRVLFINNRHAIEQSGTPERLKFLEAMKCKAVKNGKHLSQYDEKSDQEPRADHREPSDAPCEVIPLPLSKNSVFQEAEQVPQSDFSDLACYTPIEPYPYAGLQESPFSLLAHEPSLSYEDREVDLQTDSLPSFIDEEFSLYPPEDTQCSFFVLPDSDAFDQHLFYLDPANMRVHTSIDPDLILLTPHLKRRGALNSSNEVKRQRTLF